MILSYFRWNCWIRLWLIFIFKCVNSIEITWRWKNKTFKMFSLKKLPKIVLSSSSLLETRFIRPTALRCIANCSGITIVSHSFFDQSTSLNEVWKEKKMCWKIKFVESWNVRVYWWILNVWVYWLMWNIWIVLIEKIVKKKK